MEENKSERKSAKNLLLAVIYLSLETIATDNHLTFSSLFSMLLSMQTENNTAYQPYQLLEIPYGI